MPFLLKEIQEVLYRKNGDVLLYAGENWPFWGEATEAFRSQIKKKLKGTKLVRGVFLLMDSLVGECAEDYVILCQPDCSLCCHRMPMCTTLEMQLIAEYLKSKPQEHAAPVLSEAMTKAVGYESLVSAHNHKRRITAPGEETDGQFEFTDPCPFLGEHALCEIYPVRPIDCRVVRATGMACVQVPAPERRFLKFVLDQIACDIISQEEQRIFGGLCVAPMANWLNSKEFQKILFGTTDLDPMDRELCPALEEAFQHMF